MQKMFAGILKTTEETRTRIGNRNPVVQIKGSGSVSISHGSGTLPKINYTKIFFPLISGPVHRLSTVGSIRPRSVVAIQQVSSGIYDWEVGRNAYPTDLEESLLLLWTDVLLVALTEGEEALVPQHRQLPLLTPKMRKKNFTFTLIFFN